MVNCKFITLALLTPFLVWTEEARTWAETRWPARRLQKKVGADQERSRKRTATWRIHSEAWLSFVLCFCSSPLGGELVIRRGEERTDLAWSEAVLGHVPMCKPKPRMAYNCKSAQRTWVSLSFVSCTRSYYESTHMSWLGDEVLPGKF